MTIAVVLSIFISGCAASVDFSHSTLYDLYDFVDQEEVLIPKCDNGCVMYASTESLPNYNTFEDNLIIYDNGKEQNLSSITDFSRQYDEETSRKIPLIINGPANISVKNLNSDPFPFPTQSIVLYVVDQTAEDYFGYYMYDAQNMKHLSIAFNGAITVMSAYPFTVAANESVSPNGVTAWLTGFDNARNFNYDDCPEAFSMTPTDSFFPGFRLNIAGPIISFKFEGRNFPPAVEFDVTTEFFHTFDFANDGFVSSPGYNGCRNQLTGEIQSFRSDFLAQSDSYSLSAQDKYLVSIDIQPNLDENHKVTITDYTNQRLETVTGELEKTLHFETTWHIGVDFNSLKGDQGFLLRYTSEIAPSSTMSTRSTTRAPTSSSTTTRISATSSSVTSTTASATTTTRGTNSDEKISTSAPGTSTTITTQTPTTSSSYDVKSVLLSTMAVFVFARMC